MNRSLAALLLLGLSLSSLADCQIRSSITVADLTTDSRPTDARYLVTPDNISGYECSVRYRIHYEGAWHDVEGTSHGETKTDACAHALDVNRGYILAGEKATHASAETQMVCSDRPELHVHPVAIGDNIWESETEFPSKSGLVYFKYQGDLCRFFEERGVRHRTVAIYTGVICRNGDTPESKWRVVDKF